MFLAGTKSLSLLISFFIAVVGVRRNFWMVLSLVQLMPVNSTEPWTPTTMIQLRLQVSPPCPYEQLSGWCCTIHNFISFTMSDNFFGTIGNEDTVYHSEGGFDDSFKIDINFTKMAFEETLIVSEASSIFRVNYCGNPWVLKVVCTVPSF